MSLFDEYKAFVKGEEVTVTNFFMLNRLLSCSPDFVLHAISLNKYVGYLPNEELQTLFRLVVPKRKKSIYVNYPKKTKQKYKKTLAAIRKAFGVNTYHADQILNILHKKHGHVSPFFGLKEGE